MNLTSSISTESLPEAWVERLFERMLLEYGKKFGDQWANADMNKLIAYWAAELAGYTGGELKRGLEALGTRDWPPTLPEFKKLCRRPMDMTSAYYEAVSGVQARAAGEHGRWTHPAIYWAAVPIAYELSSQPYLHIRSRWEAALTVEIDKGEWEQIPAPLLSLAAPGKSVTSSDKAKKAIADMVGRVVHKPANYDNKGWARRILAREAAGESLLPIQIRFARQALEGERAPDA